jgi:hypothetical protein
LKIRKSRDRLKIRSKQLDWFKCRHLNSMTL